MARHPNRKEHPRLTLNALLPRGQFCKLNVSALLRTDLKSRYVSYAIGLDKGFLTLDEVRALEDREPLPTTQPRQIEPSDDSLILP